MFKVIPYRYEDVVESAIRFFDTDSVAYDYAIDYVSDDRHKRSAIVYDHEGAIVHHFIGMNDIYDLALDFLSELQNDLGLSNTEMQVAWDRWLAGKS